MLRIAVYNPRSGKTVFGKRELLERYRTDPDSLIWVDSAGGDNDEERRLFKEEFDLNDLAIDDCQRERHPPKLEWFDDYFFLLLKGFTAETHSIDYSIVHISFFVGQRFIVTRHALPSPSIDRIWGMLESGKASMEKGPVHICYRIVRTIIDRYTPIIMNLEERLDDLEEEMYDDPSDKLLAELSNYNSRLKKLRRIFGYQASVLGNLKGSSAEIFAEENMHEFNDLHEQMERLSSLTGLLQELARDLMDGYITLSSHRLNKIMKVLTITAVIFLPLSLLAGIYGMNFEHMPELRIQDAYYIVVGVMVAIAVGLLSLFRYLKWL
jgi:magnesium transporter